MRKQLLFTTIIVTCLLCACAKENKNVSDDVSIGESTSTNEDAAAEEASVTQNTSYKYVADYDSYDELIEDIKNLPDRDEDIFFDKAQQYEWFNFFISMNLEDDNFGYLQVDIDGDGVDELLLGSNSSEENSDDAYIGSMFTIRNGKVCPVFQSYSDRELYNLYENGVFEAYLREPNVYYSSEYFKYTAGKQEFIEGIYQEVGYSDSGVQVNYYYTDSASKKHELNEKEYHDMGETLKNKYNRPKIQLHLFKE